MKVILSFRYQLHKLKLLQGIYLSFASLFTIVSGLYWGLLSMQLASTLNYLWVLIGLIHGFLAWFFIPKEKTVKIIIYAILFSLLTLLIAKYIFYMHFFHLQSSFVIDKSVVSMALVIQYLHWLEQSTYQFFFRTWIEHFTFAQSLWLLAIVASAFVYRLFDKAEQNFLDNNREKAGVKHHMIKRRF